MSSHKTVIAVGSSGFLGSHFLNAMHPHLRVVGTYHSKKKENTGSGLMESTFHVSELKDYLVKEDVTGIINCAVKYSGTPRAMYQTNVELPLQLLDLCQSFQIPKLYLFDTFYSFSGVRYSHLSAYTELKQKARDEIIMRKDHGVDINWIVLGHIFGENDGDQKFVPNLIKSLVKDEDINLTAGKQMRDFTYVKSVVDKVLEDIFQQPEKIGLKQFYLGSGTKRTIRYFVEHCRAISRSSSKLNFGKIDYRENEIMNPFTGSKEIESIELEEGAGFEEGLKRTVEHYRHGNKGAQH